MNAHDAPTGAGFTVDAGAGLLAARGDPQRRRTVVQEAFASLLQIRRLMNTCLADPLSVPADWERTQVVRAVALALEAAGIEPSAADAEGDPAVTGYSVTETGRPRTVRVRWLGPRGSGATYQAQQALRHCARTLTELGWTALECRTARGHRHLDVEPPFRAGR